jgi:mannose-6-phosphate isomerase-like protein (cupin superfamily)
MIVRQLNKCKKFISGDKVILRELLHADKVNFKFRYSLAHAIVKPGKSSKPHRLKTSEVYYILEGRGLMHVDKKTARVKSGSALYIPPHSTQYIENTGNSDLVFLCIVDPAWRKKDEEII